MLTIFKCRVSIPNPPLILTRWFHFPTNEDMQIFAAEAITRGYVVDDTQAIVLHSSRTAIAECVADAREL